MGGVLIVLGQEMQEFGRLGMLSEVCGSCDPVHPLIGTILQEILKIVYPPIPFHYTYMHIYIPPSISR